MSGSATGQRVGARVGEEVRRLAEVRRGGDGVGELRRELAEAQVLAALVDEPEGGGVPEAGGAAVAEQHLVAVGEGEQLGEPVAQRTHLELHAGLAVGGAEVVAARPRPAPPPPRGAPWTGRSRSARPWAAGRRGS